jgi:sugar (pentulose or hexulose) kinase
MDEMAQLSAEQLRPALLNLLLRIAQHCQAIRQTKRYALNYRIAEQRAVTESQLMDEMAQLSAEQLRQAPLFLPYLSGERTPPVRLHC